MHFPAPFTATEYSGSGFFHLSTVADKSSAFVVCLECWGALESNAARAVSEGP